jgi:hypothetical protein
MQPYLELEQRLRIKAILKIPVHRIEKKDESFNVYSSEKLVGTINYTTDEDGQIQYDKYDIDWGCVFELYESHLRMELLVYFTEAPHEVSISTEFRHVWVTVEKKGKPKHIRFDYDTSWKMFSAEG